MIRDAVKKIGGTKPAVVVIGLDSMQGLQTARIFARHGIPVVGLSDNPRHPSRWTRSCRQVIHAPTADEGLISTLEELSSHFEQKPVLVPCEDPNVALVAHHRARLDEAYHVLVPPADVVDLLMDKVNFCRYALEKRFPIPRTCIVECRGDLEQAAKDLQFPCIIKPRNSATLEWEHKTVFKAFKVSGPQALREIYERYETCTDCFIVQEWIEGDDSTLYSCNAYFNAKSEPIVTFVARKLRQWPPETGISCLGEECRNDVVLNESIRLFQSLDYRGLGYLEMKRDRRTGEHLIIEPNIGRPTGRSAIAEAGGVELLYSMYCDALGWPLPANRQQTYSGVKWVYLRKDMQSSYKYWRRGELNLRQWWKSMRGKKRTPWGPGAIQRRLSATGSMRCARFSHRLRARKGRLDESLTTNWGWMLNTFFEFAQTPVHHWWIESLMACRALAFRGGRFKCPCCGWNLRSFTHGGTSWRRREQGYCPRCNSKARHRRNWLYLAEHTNLFTHPLRLLHVSPKYALSRRFIKMTNLDYVGVDRDGRPNIQRKVDITSIPYDDESFDALICIHVLEHVENDRQALRELYRVLKHGAWALITVPLQLGKPTYEDPSITAPEARKQAFGEEQHVRVYGDDFSDRLADCGFRVELHRGSDIDASTRATYGLLDNENIHFCTKP